MNHTPLTKAIREMIDSGEMREKIRAQLIEFLSTDNANAWLHLGVSTSKGDVQGLHIYLRRSARMFPVSTIDSTMVMDLAVDHEDDAAYAGSLPTNRSPR